MDAKDVFALARFAPDKMQKVSLYETPNFFCDVYGLEPGQEQRVHTHGDADKVYCVLDGRGVFLVGDEERELGAHQIVIAPAGEPHGVRNAGDARLTLLVLMSPNPNFKR
jgi:mannose-6-phosphate isomerase-like protein (cupin superfamily)